VTAQVGDSKKAVDYQKKTLADADYDKKEGNAARGRLSLYELEVPFRN
jgi:hypothetical protein